MAFINWEIKRVHKNHVETTKKLFGGIFKSTVNPDISETFSDA